MTTYSKILIGGSVVNDVYNCTVVKSIGENNMSSSFSAEIENFGGRNHDLYTIGQETIICAGSAAISGLSNIIFRGILEDQSFEGDENNEKMLLEGRDYTARMMDRTVEPEVYTNLSAGSIVRDMVIKYTNDITVSGVQDSDYIVERITFSHKPVFDAVKKMADLADYTFYIDEHKDLKFIPKGGSSSGYTFDSQNVKEADFKEQRDTIYNQIWVYGDRYLDGYREQIIFGSPVTGSSIYLLYNPHNTEVSLSGTIPTIVQPGEIEGVIFSAGSTTQYLVNYGEKRITFVSGTSQGDNIPASGTRVIVNYKRSLPIVKVGDDEVSKSLYGTRVKVINDKDIKDSITAQQIMIRELEKSAYPEKQGELKINGIIDVTPGETCIVNLPYHGVDNQTYDILEAKYDLSSESTYGDDVLKVRVNKKLPDITDTMKDILLELRKLQSSEMSEQDILTRYQFTTGSESIRTSGLTVYTQDIGSSFILGHGAFGSTATGSISSYPLFENYVSDELSDDNCVGSIYPRGMNFTVGNTGSNSTFKVALIKLKMYRIGNPGQVYFNLYNTAASKPSGIVFALGSFNGNSLGTDSAGSLWAVVMSPGSCIAGSMYSIVVSAPNATEIPPNSVNWRKSETGGYTGGGRVFSNNSGGTWSYEPNRDSTFYVYGSGVVFENTYGDYYSGNGILGSATIYNYPIHVLGDQRSSSVIYWSGGYS